MPEPGIGNEPESLMSVAVASAWSFEAASVALMSSLVERLKAPANRASPPDSLRGKGNFARANTRRRTRLYSAELLESVRVLPAKSVLGRLLENDSIASWKVDTEFKPMKNPSTRRVYVGLKTGFVVEILITQPPGADLKWHDGRSGASGGGAIDLVMHLTDMGFKQAVNLLKGTTLPSG